MLEVFRKVAFRFGGRPTHDTTVRDRLRTYMDALRNLARNDVPDRAELIERNVDRYVKDEIGGRQRALERLRQAIHNEETERREGEDWSLAKDYVRSVAEHDGGLTPRMLPNHQYPIPQREPLIGIIRNRRIHRSMSDRNASRRRNHISRLTVAAALTARIRSLSTRARRRSVSSRSTLAYNIVARHQIVNT